MLLALVCACASRALKNGEVIPVFGSQVNPLYNPLEIYDSSYVPTCPMADKSAPPEPPFLRRIFGNRLIQTGYVIKFLEPVKEAVVCEMKLDAEKVERFEKLARRKFISEIYIGKLPEVFSVGSVTPMNLSLVYTHHRFVLSHNNQHVVEVKVVTERPVTVRLGEKIKFTYSVEWRSTSKVYRQRFDRYCDLEFCQHPVRKYAMINGCVLALLLVLLTLYILTTFLGNDMRRFERESEINEVGAGMENGSC